MSLVDRIRQLWYGLTLPDEPEGRENFNCPVCGFLTLGRDERFPSLCQWDICSVCFWEDDSNYLGSGANHGINLAQARESYVLYGAMSPEHAKFVRPPTKIQRDGWKQPQDATTLMNKTRERYAQSGGNIIKFYCDEEPVT